MDKFKTLSNPTLPTLPAAIPRGYDMKDHPRHAKLDMMTIFVHDVCTKIVLAVFSIQLLVAF